MAKIDTAFLLATDSNIGYPHWVMEYLPLLEGLVHYESRTGTEPAILIPRDAPSWMIEFLMIFGISEERLWKCREARITTDSLIVPTFRHIYPKIFSKEEREVHNGTFVQSPAALRWVRDQFRDARNYDGDTELPKKVYLSRENVQEENGFTDERRVLNESELLPVIEERGFVRYHPSELSIRDQIQLFSNAEAVLSPNGGALTNIVFGEDLTVIDMQGKRKHPRFMLLSTELGHTYAPFGAEPIGSHIKVSPEKLTAFLNELNL
jgi:capsular polysaccharide biosynthesis protein